MNADEHRLNELSGKIIGAAFAVSNVHIKEFQNCHKGMRTRRKTLVTWWLRGRKKLLNARFFCAGFLEKAGINQYPGKTSPSFPPCEGGSLKDFNFTSPLIPSFARRGKRGGCKIFKLILSNYNCNKNKQNPPESPFFKGGLI